MQKENKSDTSRFDLEVGSLLRNAAADVPKRAWEGIEARLDSAARNDGATGRWIWAGAGLAMAAALAAVLFFGGTFRGDVTEAGTPVAEAVVGRTDGGEQEVLAVETVADKKEDAVITVKAAEPVKIQAVVKTEEEVVVTVKSEAMAETAATETETETKTEKKTETVAGNAAMLAMLEKEDETERKPVPVSIQISGIMGSNESRINSGKDSRYFMSSGTAVHSQSCLEDESISSYDIPLSFGIGIRLFLAKRLSIGTGVNYSILGRTFSGTYYEVQNSTLVRSVQGDIRHNIQYIGIPLNVYFDFIKGNRVSCYAYAGGTGEICVSNKYRIEDVTFSDPVNKLQLSLGAGLGVQFNVTDFLGLYLDPGVRYFFRCDQPKSIRTDMPFMMTFEAGARFEL